MPDWTKVITHPLGLAGFALFLIFGLLAKVKRRDERRWLPPIAIVMALIALVGGLGLAYMQIRGQTPPLPSQTSRTPASSQQQTNQVQQTTTAPGSPTVQGVQGDVTITVDQSSGKTETTKTQAKKSQQKRTQ